MKADRVNTVVFNLHQIKCWAFFFGGGGGGHPVYDWIEKIGNLLAGSKTLSFINNIIADETLDKRRNSLLDLAISGRHKGPFTVITDAILHLCSPKHEETNKNALCLVSEEASRLGYYSRRE